MKRMSFSETIFLFFLALIIFGPKKLPEIARQVGKYMNEFKRASNEFKAQIEQEISNLEVDKRQTILPPSPTSGRRGQPHALLRRRVEIQALPTAGRFCREPNARPDSRVAPAASADEPLFCHHARIATESPTAVSSFLLGIVAPQHHAGIACLISRAARRQRRRRKRTHDHHGFPRPPRRTTQAHRLFDYLGGRRLWCVLVEGRMALRLMQKPIVDVLQKHNGLPEKLVFLNPTDPFNLYLKVAALGRSVSDLSVCALSGVDVYFAWPLPQRKALCRALHGFDDHAVRIRRIFRIPHRLSPGAGVS